MRSKPDPCAVLVVGRFGSAYGVKGWIRLTSFTVPVGNVLEYRPWHLQRNGEWQVLAIDGARLHQKGVVAHIDGVDDRTAAERFSGLEIGVAEEALPAPEPDEYYWKDLVGLTVVDLEGAPLGRVSRLIETGANDVLIVDGESGQLLIPFVRHVVTNVDLTGGRIVADWRADY